MKRMLRNVAAASVGALMLMGVATASANAYYLGYGDGDPGPWDMWQEQNPGHAEQAQASHLGAGNSCGYFHTRATQTGSSHWWHRYEQCIHH